MLAFTSVWIALATLILSVVMLVHRAAMTDWTIPLVLWFGAPAAICLAGLVLWAHRKDRDPDPGLAGQRRQARTAIAMSIAAAAIVYGLIIFSDKLN